MNSKYYYNFNNYNDNNQGYSNKFAPFYAKVGNYTNNVGELRSTPTRFNYYSKYPRIASTLRQQTNDKPDVDAQNKLFDVTKYGAIGDGVTDDTKAINNAINAAINNKGGNPQYSRNTILFPSKKRFLTSGFTITGASNIAIQLLAFTTIQIKPFNSDSPPIGITLSSVKNFVIEGVDAGLSYIHGAGNSWSHTCGSRNEPYDYSPFNLGKTSPVAILLINLQSSEILIRNLSFFHAPGGHVIFKKASQVEVYNIRVISAADSHNTDAVHLDEVSGGTFYNSFVCNGDDCVAINSADPVNDIEVHHLTLTSGHGISFGSSIVQNIDTVYVHDIVGSNLLNGIRFKSQAGTTGTISNVTFENYQMNNVTNAIVIQNGTYHSFVVNNNNQFKNAVGSSQNGATLKNIYLHNITGKTIKHAGTFQCGTENQCQDITLDTIDFEDVTDTPWECDDAAKLTVSSITPTYKCSKIKTYNLSDHYNNYRGQSAGCSSCKDCSY